MTYEMGNDLQNDTAISRLTSLRVALGNVYRIVNSMATRQSVHLNIMVPAKKIAAAQ